MMFVRSVIHCLFVVILIRGIQSSTETPNYPFQQFELGYYEKYPISCDEFDQVECVDLVLILSMPQLLNIEVNRIMDLTSSLPDSIINNCDNRYGLTLYGLSTGTKVVSLSSGSIFGTAQELRTAIYQNQFIESMVGAGIQDGYMGIHDVIEQYKFRDGVMRRILLFTNEARQTTTSSSQYNYEDTLLLLLKNNISLSVVSNGAEYTTELSQERLIGIIYNNRIGFGLYSETDCTNPLELVQDAQYSVIDRDVYVSYNELGWSTGGAVFDINYFQSSTYCPELLLEAVTLAVFLDATCEGLTYTYENRTDDGSYIIWDDINPQSFSNCVDMIFIVDRSGSMDNYYPSIINLASNLPTNGESCVNRYGLTLFEENSTVQYIGGGNTNLFGTPTELAAAFSFVQSGRDEDGLLAINDVIDNYSFRSDVQKHVVLFTDEPRTAVLPSVTKLSVLDRLNERGIILSVVTDAHVISHSADGSISYTYAAIKISNTFIGFADGNSITDIIDAISPVFLNTLDSNAEENYVDLAWETGGIAFDLFFFDNSLYDTRSSAVFNKLMFSWGGRANSSSLTTTYAPVLVSAINSTLISPHTGDLIFSFGCISTSTSDSNVSLLVDGDWYTNLNSGNIEQSVVFEYPYPHPGSYDFLCVANNSIGGDQTLGVYTVPDALRIYPQYSQFTYIPDSHIECGTTSLQESQCVDLVVVIDINAYTDATIDRIISFTASLPANSTTCLNRYGLTLYGTSTLSQIILLTNSPTQSYFSTPSDLSSAIQTQRNIGISLGSGSRDGYEAIDKVVKLYSFRSDVQKKIIFFSNEVREVAPTFSNLTFQSTIQTLLANRITLSTVSNADNFYYFYNNTDNRLIGMHYNTRTGIGNFSSSCNPTLDNIVSIPSVEYSIIREGEHKDYVELAWRTDGTAFDLSYFEQSSGYCSELVDAIIQYAVVQNFPCTLNIVDYAFTSRSQFPDYFIWENILPQVTPICLDMVFLFDVSVLSSNYFTKLINLINNLAVTPTLCDHVYTAYSYSDGYDAIEFFVNNHPFETDYIKSIIVITEFGRNSIYPQFTKSSTLDSLLSNGIILSVISSAGDFYYGTSPPVNILAAVRVSDTLIGFRSSGINNTILDAISTVNYTITDSNIDNDYVDIAWQTGGVSFDIDLITEDISPFATLMFIWGNPAPIEILSMSVTSQGALNDPGPYQFTCTINDVPHATLTLIIDGVSYVSTDTTTITRVLSLSNLIPDIYEFLCIASNSNGGDTQRSQFTIIEPIPSPFSQFAFIPESGETCDESELKNCVDLIFILDISTSIHNELERIAELAGNLPELTGICDNRYGLVLFGLQTPTAMNVSTRSLYGTPSQLKSVILSSQNIGNNVGNGAEDGLFAIHLAAESYPFRTGVERRLALFADEPRQPYSAYYTYEDTISLLFQNEIKLTAFTYFGDIFYYTASTELIGMNFFSNIGFGNLSSTDTDINVVPNPYLKLDSGSSDESFVKLAFNTDGSIFNMKYMSNDTTPYSPELIAELFEFAVIHDVPCNLDDVYFNFENRTLTYSSPLYSKWMHITPQVQSNCVDMVFLVDRTITFRQFMPGVMSIANNLPENGNGCVNRYGLVTFETTAIIINVGVSTKFGTANQLYNQLISFSYSGATEDGYVGIDAIVNEFEFRDSDTIQKHIILFGDEPRRIVNSSLTDTSILQALVDNNIILTVATTADNFYQLDYTTRLHVAALISNSYIGFASNGTNQEYVDVYSPIDLYTYSSNQHDSYVALAWQSGGLAFDLDYFRDSLINMRTVVTLFNTLMFSWGSPAPIQIIPSSYEANNQLTIECSTNDVSNPSISLIVGDQLYSNTNSNSLQTTFSSWNYSTYSYICIAYNSVGGASDIATLDIEIPNGLPVNYSLTVQSSESILVEWERSVGSNIVLISYRVVYQGILFDTVQYTATTTDTDVILENLSPFTSYSVYIIANTPSNSSQTDAKIATTFQYPPTESPQNITAIPVNSTTILINMYPPSVNHQNGPIRNYTISYQQGEQEITTFIILNTMGTYPLEISSQIYVSSLLPFTNYTFTIIATNDAGSSPSTNITTGTHPTAPSQPPQNITTYSNNATSITVVYYPPPSFYQNGIITRYLITIQGTPFDSELKEISVPVTTLVYPLLEEGKHIFTQLQAYNTYSIRVTAVNSIGAGPISNAIYSTTKQSAPTESPQTITATTINSTTILINMYPPSVNHQNGPIRNYTISYQQGEQEITLFIILNTIETYPLEISSQISVYSLLPFTNYTFTIIATNDAGSSPSTSITTRTHRAAPSQPPQNITAYSNSATSITVVYYPPPSFYQNGIITRYLITIQGTPFDSELKEISVPVNIPVYPLLEEGRHIFTQLHAFNTYSIRVTAVNSIGAGPISPAFNISTLQSAPTESPQTITATTINSTTILINIYPPSANHQNGPIRNYSISYQQGEQEISLFIILNTMGTYPLEISSQIYVSSLLPFANYTFTIIATNDAGSSPSTNITTGTHPTAPSQPPQNITTYSNNATAITVVYYPPPSFYQNGIITRYLITIQGTPFDSELKEISVPVNLPVYPLLEEGRHIFTQLHAYNTYSIRVTAVNSVGAGPTSPTFNISTLQSAPTESPQTITVTTINSTTILINMYPPSVNHQNGPIRNYTISYQQGEQEVTTFIILNTMGTYPLEISSQIYVSSLLPFTNYTFIVIATNDAGSSPSTSITTGTHPTVPSQPPQNITTYSNNATSITVVYYPPPSFYQNGIITRYLVTIQGTPFDSELKEISVPVNLPVYPLLEEGRHIFTQLHAYNTYSIRVTAVNSVGAGPTSSAINSTTLQSAPSQPPQNITAHSNNATSITVVYYPPPSFYQNGIITRYLITIQGTPFDSELEEISVPVNIPVYPLLEEGRHIFTQLHAYNTYSIRVTAVNNAGSGPTSPAINSTTLQSAPTDSPQNVTANPINSTSILLTCLPPSPALQNGPIRNFTVLYHSEWNSNTIETASILIDSSQSYPFMLLSEIVISSLQPYTKYTFSIIAINDAGESLNVTVTTRTHIAAPTESPQTITATTINSTTILINMYPPSVNHQNGPIRNYTISYQQGEQEITTFIILNTMGTYPLEISSQVYVSSLLPFTNYTFTIIATNDAGSSPSTSITTGTHPTVPSHPPQNITAYSNSATSITVVYYPPPSFYQNGIITRYLITIQGTPFDSELKEISVPVNIPVYPLLEEGRHIFTQLQAYNTYSIRVTAVSSVGAGLTSSPIIITTLQSDPTESPQSITAIPMSSTSILLTCLPPSPTLQNGPIRNFTILYHSEWNSNTIETASILIDSSQSYPLMSLSEIVISSLQPYTKYTFSIIAINDAGESPNVTVTTRTRIAAPTESPQTITATTINSTTILINMYPPSVNHQNGPIRNYTISYQQGEQEITTFIILNTMETYPLEISSQIHVSSLLPFTNYTFTIIATNDAGSSPSTAVSIGTHQADSVPIITSPLSDMVINPELSLTYIEQFICEATGYPPPTILWYSNNEPVTTGATLTLTTSNVTDGKEYICKAENDFGIASRSITISITFTYNYASNILDNIIIELDNPDQFDGVIDILSNILTNISITDIDQLQDMLNKIADTVENLFDIVTDHDKAMSVDDAGSIMNIIGDIVNKDTGLNNSALPTDSIDLDVIAIATEALVTALRIVEKVCDNLGRNYFQNLSIRDSLTVESTYVNIYGANIPISHLLTDETFPINTELEDYIIIPENVIRNLADDRASMKLVTAIIEKHGIPQSYMEMTDPTQDSRIMVVIVPGSNGNVTLIENANIIFSSSLANNSNSRIGTFLFDNLWIADGITTELSSNTNTSLIIDHFTSFAVFTTSTHTPQSSSIEIYLAVVSYFISAISVLCMIASLLLFIIAGKKGFFKIEINIFYFNLCIALLICNLLFLLYGLQPTLIGISFLPCKMIAALIHYSWILVFTWCFSFALYMSYKIKYGNDRKRKIYPFIIIFAWVFPILFPAITLAIKLDVYVDVTKHCFPSLTDYVLIGLLAPVLVIAAITIVMVVILSIAFVVVKKKIENELMRNEIKHILLSTTLMICILTIPWFALVIFVFTESPVIEWTFVLLNDTVGIFFFVFIALRVKEVILLLRITSTKVKQHSYQMNPRSHEIAKKTDDKKEFIEMGATYENVGIYSEIDVVRSDSTNMSAFDGFANPTYLTSPIKDHTQENYDDSPVDEEIHHNPFHTEPSSKLYSNDSVIQRMNEANSSVFSNAVYTGAHATGSDSITRNNSYGISNPFYDCIPLKEHTEKSYKVMNPTSKDYDDIRGSQ
ncbi:Phosphatidylinositol phosphatase [Oopsacas minuta]|uniref:Phosphatidylinositol phosphatase n=1 Tax=Oopsacas minuta TaxID=111878 RepID=A0AAV7K0T2_9METZ|nr:Phosphatidylinositol phosphatase [Oopsacas minuta]